jgi:hypothetical protein
MGPTILETISTAGEMEEGPEGQGVTEVGVDE